ncbi:unnamed protein product [Candida verbasci]|uniref:Sedlin n=1 Tax=Candida verbasci TaxID=1227364 RepID=A0A9W4XMI8_9ASCO|nr:unnamed protein product [Candida verbasci]
MVESVTLQDQPPMENPIQFISIISRNEKPIYIQQFNTDTKNVNKFLKYNFLSHMALDLFTSPTSLSLKEQQGNNDIILLFIQDQIMVYGYETNNGLKILIGLNQNYTIDLKKLKVLFLNIHKSYLKILFNPFNQMSQEDEIENKSFDENLKKLVSEFI